VIVLQPLLGRASVLPGGLRWSSAPPQHTPALPQALKAKINVWENHGKAQLDNLRCENSVLKNELEEQKRKMKELEESTKLAALQSAQLASGRLAVPGLPVGLEPALPDSLLGAPQQVGGLASARPCPCCTGPCLAGLHEHFLG
jgi:hypothetical protein